LEYQVSALEKAGVRRAEITIVSGYMHDLVESAATHLGVNTLFNPSFSNTNNIVSLACFARWAASQAASEIIVLNCDVLAHPGIFQELTANGLENGIVIDESRRPDHEAMKVRVEGGRVRALGKHLPAESCAGEYIGLAKFSGQGLGELFAAVEGLVAAGRRQDWYEEAFNKIADRVRIGLITTQGLPWIEIDTLEDYERAQTLYCQLVQ
jgi:choline kinase